MCLLMLSHDGFLRVLNANTGKELRSVFISTAITFRCVYMCVTIQVVLSTPFVGKINRRVWDLVGVVFAIVQ